MTKSRTVASLVRSVHSWNSGLGGKLLVYPAPDSATLGWSWLLGLAEIRKPSTTIAGTLTA